MRQKTEAMIGQGDEAVKRFVGQKVWLAIGSIPLYLAAFSDDGTSAIVEWLDDDFVEHRGIVTCTNLSAYDPSGLR